jgi:hypothetical protein
MKANWSELQTQLLKDGYVILDNLFPNDLIAKWRKEAEDLSIIENRPGINHINKKFDKVDLETRDSIGEYKFVSIDGRVSLKIPGLKEYYHSLTNFLSLFTGMDIVESFDEQSSLSLMVYKPPGGTLLPHFDSQSLSFLLYLTDNLDEGATKLLPISALRPTNINHPDEIIGEPIKIYPKSNRSLIFFGRRVWHSSEPVFKSTKISAVFNYYEKGDDFRPKGVSERLYK